MKRFSMALLLCMAPVLALAQSIPGHSGGVYRHGEFVWFDLMTKDPNAAKRFYSHLFGWEFSKDANGYSIIRSDGEYLGAIVLNDELESDAVWIGSVSVADVANAVQSARAAGGTVLVDPEQLTGRGLSAVIEDPMGAVYAVLKAEKGDIVYDKVTSGDWMWTHLWTPDAAASSTYYGRALGLRRDGDRLTNGHSSLATIVDFDWDDVPASWLPVALVPDIAEATARVTALGGSVYLEPEPDFADGEMALVADPTGGAFLMQEWQSP